MDSNSKRVRTLLGGVFVVLNFMVPLNSFAVSVNTATDTLAACAPANQILNSTPAVAGCRRSIVGDYGDFRIINASATNTARVEFVQGSVDRLVLTGATILADVDIASPFDITFSHLFQDTNPGGDVHAQLALSGGFNLRVPNSTARTVTGAARADLCTSSALVDCPSIAPLVPTRVGSIAAGSFTGSFAPSPVNENDIGTGLGSFTYLEGNITISSLRQNERVSALSLSILSGVSLPAVDGGCSLGPPPATEDISIPPDGIPDRICANVFGFADPIFIPINNTLGDFVSGPAGDPDAAVPEPSTVILLGSGMATLWAIRRRRASWKE